MFTRFFRRIKNGRSVVDTTTVEAEAPKATASTTTDKTLPLYEVTLPGEPVVRLRAKNQTEVRKMVRAANSLKRLPAGTTVERVDS